METAVKIAAAAMIAAVLCLLLRETCRPLSVLVSLGSCAVVLLLGLRFLTPVLSVMERLQRLSGLSDVITMPLLKTAAIGILTQVASGICSDAGETALAKISELSGTVLSIYVSLPLLSAVLELLEELLGGV